MLLIRLSLVVMALLIGPALAQEPAARLDRLPDVWVLTREAEGEHEDIDDLIAEQLPEVQAVAKRRGIKLTERRVVIWDRIGLKDFDAKLGFVVDGDGRGARPARGKERNFVLHRLPHLPAFVASGDGTGDKVNKVRGTAFREAFKQPHKRYRKIEAIDIYAGDPHADNVKVDAYVPLNR